MNKKIPLSVTIITLNEEKNIAQAIESVNWADEIIVVDSGSTDQTVNIAKNLGAKIFQHFWEGYGQQKNFAQSQTSHDWVLSLDADERISPELAKEIQIHLKEILQFPTSDIHGFYIPRLTFYLNQWIYHGGWYPNYLIRLSNKKHSRWTEPHVHETLKVEGKSLYMKSNILHFSFRNIQDQIYTNLKFSRLGSDDLKRRGKKASILKLIIKPIGKFIETYLIKKGFLDGLPGFIISVNAAHSMFLKYAYLFEENLKNESTHS